jgi:GNAT superfamily N-acetyltransferase
MADSSSPDIVQADLERGDHRADVLALTAAYALDPMGKGSALAQEALDRLIDGLRRHPTTLIFLAYLQGQAAGIATCFLGFSTFFARPLLNIHDFAILPRHRGRGLGRHLLRAVEAKALELGCCKITLEVQENNVRARRVYERAGFAQAVYREATGGSLFYAKILEEHVRG